MSDQPIQQPEVFPCPTCGGQMSYDAAAGAMRCRHCSQQSQIAGGGQMVREISIEEGMRMAQRGLGVQITSIECEECGATVNVGQGEQTVRCRFCRSHKVLPREAAGNLITPESLVPFRVDKQAAASAFTTWLKGLWFRPGDLKDLAKVEEMAGVYIPFWTFDAQVLSRWSAEAGYHYQETERYTDSEGKEQTREVTKTRWEPASGSRQDFFDDVIICASKGLPENLVDRFRSWTTSELIPYQPSYLAGWSAESYAIDLIPAWHLGQREMEETQRSRCGSDVPGDTYRNLDVSNSFSAATFKHVLLPIWIAAYRYGGEPYQFLVNGQTGEVVGRAPYSTVKIILFVLALAAIVAAIVMATRM